MATAEYPNHFTELQVAAMLGYNPVTIRKWRGKNAKAGCIKHGPPYEYHGRFVLYPKAAYRAWFNHIEVIDGVPRMNAPIKAHIDLPVGEEPPVDLTLEHGQQGEAKIMNMRFDITPVEVPNAA